MNRAVVCVATNQHYKKGIERLAAVQTNSGKFLYRYEPYGSPSHTERPYAFKAYALEAVRKEGYELLLWCDSSILPIRSLEPLWKRIETEGYWISRNGWNNYEWTADSAYPDLFALEYSDRMPDPNVKAINRIIPHVVATAFGLNIKHPKGRAFLDEYYRLASETKAFCGPWTNADYGIPEPYDGIRVAPCGPSDVRGHRHDQTAASVIAWRLGMKLTDPPNVFAYSRRRADGTLHMSDQDQSTILLADGRMDDMVIHD